ncbi:MAG: glycosyltransferase [Anaerolineae bacterium]
MLTTAPLPSLKHVLMVAYNYPPLENTGITRTVKFAKYLPQFGYKPVILTTRTYGCLPDDAASLTFRVDDMLGLVKRTFLAWQRRQGVVSQHSDIRLLPPGGRLERWKAAYLAPDPKIIWYPPALQQAQKIIKTLPIRCLYSTSPPESAHLVALKLKRETGLPWVADLRDGWLFEPHLSARLTSAWRHRLEANLESKVMAAADRIITINEVLAADLTRRYPQAAAKVSVITNGFDPDDFAHLRWPTTPATHFQVIYTGSLALSRAGTSIAGLLQALQTMRAARLEMMEQLKVVLVGNLAPAEVRAIEQAGLSPYFSLVAPLPYQQALQYQVEAAALLLVIAPDSTGVSTSKLFDYLASGRPILALSNSSPAASLVTALEAGVVVAPDDVAGIQQALQTFYQQWQAGQLPSRHHPRLSQFERRELTRQLATLFDELVRP